MPPVTAPSSASRGFLHPGTGHVFVWDDGPDGWDEAYWQAEPRAGATLDDLMQQVVAAVTGLPGPLVRPRWQLEPPNLPAVGTDWAAVGVVRSEPVGYPWAGEDSRGFSEQQDTEEFDVLCSFYGPNADKSAVALRSGLMVAQNREAFQLLSMGLVNTSGRTRVPTLTQQQWLMRVDTTFSMRRLVRQVYPVLYFLSAPAVVITDTDPRFQVPTPPNFFPPVPPAPPSPAEPAPFDIPFQYLGKPQAGQPILRYPFDRRVTLLDDMAGSFVTAKVPAASAVTLDLVLNDETPIGTLTFPAGQLAGVFASTLQVFNEGDILSVVSRSSDSALEYLAGIIFGTS